MYLMYSTTHISAFKIQTVICHGLVSHSLFSKFINFLTWRRGRIWKTRSTFTLHLLFYGIILRRFILSSCRRQRIRENRDCHPCYCPSHQN